MLTASSFHVFLGALLSGKGNTCTCAHSRAHIPAKKEGSRVGKKEAKRDRVRREGGTEGQTPSAFVQDRCSGYDKNGQLRRG